ncbi:MAG: hypothetical protein E6K80_01525 [Candidatus Eisenbacteria bacterium]|uniref:Lipocalin-like domain-containing protein n=1 Tax=Eiseniibacteriota bacterium TaxID=2212470 RepID=A0A538UAI7_UNCEI|nr:MAG: hypothetical protein E6K80_01525 [Candidatus Eisenbacteria bacterium]
MMRSRWTSAVPAAAFLVLVTVGWAVAAKPTPDLSGSWRLDPERSTAPSFDRRGVGSGTDRAPMGGRHWGGGGMEGGMGGMRGGMRGMRGGAGGGREPGDERRSQRLRLPDFLRIEQSGDELALSDSAGTVVGEIRTAKAKGEEETVGVPRFRGSWHGDRLQVVQTSAHGEMTQTYHLSDDGRTLEVKMHMQGPGGTSRDFVRVYRRESA